MIITYNSLFVSELASSQRQRSWTWRCGKAREHTFFISLMPKLHVYNQCPINCQHTLETGIYMYIPALPCVNNRVHTAPLHWTHIPVIIAAPMNADRRSKISFSLNLKKKKSAKLLGLRPPPLSPLFRRPCWYDD